ncbi:unnamed protein product [Urochloa humidicola]
MCTHRIDRRLHNDGTGMKPFGSCRCWPPAPDHDGIPSLTRTPSCFGSAGRWREDRDDGGKIVCGGRNGMTGAGARRRKWDDSCDGYGGWGGDDDGDGRWWPAGGECDGSADVDGEEVCVCETGWLGFREVEGTSLAREDRTIAQDSRRKLTDEGIPERRTKPRGRLGELGRRSMGSKCFLQSRAGIGRCNWSQNWRQTTYVVRLG